MNKHEYIRNVVNRVNLELMKGDSKLSRPMKNGEVNLSLVIKSIRTQRCLHTDKYDMGSSYLEQRLGTVVNKIVPPAHINFFRRMFGLDKISKQDLMKIHNRKNHVKLENLQKMNKVI